MPSLPDNDALLHQKLAFLRAAEPLKDTLRSAFTATGRQESAAAHSWRLCLMVMVFADQLEDVDVTKLLQLCVIHDLGEAISGDIPAPQQGTQSKAMNEREDFQHLLSSLPKRQQEELLALWDEYDQARTPEARLAKGFDKLETILQHNQGANPADFDYGFNLTYGQQYTEAHWLTAALRRLLDAETAARQQESS